MAIFPQPINPTLRRGSRFGSSMRHAWLMQSRDGVTFPDFCGANDCILTNGGGTTYISTEHGQGLAWDFDAGNSYLTLNDPISHGQADPITFTFGNRHMMVYSATSNYSALMGRISVSPRDYILQYRENVTVLQTDWRVNGGASSLLTYDVPQRVWNVLSFVYLPVSGSTAKFTIYANGEYMTETTTGRSAFAYENLGRGGTTSNTDAKLDMSFAMVHDEAFSENAIRMLHHDPFAPFRSRVTVISAPVVTGEQVSAVQTLPVATQQADMAHTVTGSLSELFPGFEQIAFIEVEALIVTCCQSLPVMTQDARLTTTQQQAFARMDWQLHGSVDRETTGLRIDGLAKGTIAIDEWARVLGAIPVDTKPAPGAAFGMYEVTTGADKGLWFSNGVDVILITYYQA